MNQLNLIGHPMAGYARVLLGLRLERFRQARASGDAGASAIELAVITAVLVALAFGVVAVIQHIVHTKCQDIITKSGPDGSGTCPSPDAG